MKIKLGVMLMAMGLAASSTACTQMEQSAASYGAGGAALGAIAGGALSGSPEGAFGGAMVGAVAGTALGANLARNEESARLCTYRDAKNRTFQAPCHP